MKPVQMEKYLINHNQVSGEIFDNEAVVVNFMTGKYFGMSGSGPEIWKYFESPVSEKDVIAILTENYSEITDEQIQEVKDFFCALLNEQLIITVDKEVCNQVPAKPDTGSGEKIFKSPKLEIYNDLQELIILDPIHDADPERGWPAQQRMLKP